MSEDILMSAAWTEDLLVWLAWLAIGVFVLIWVGSLIACFIPVKRQSADQSRDGTDDELPPALRTGTPYIDWPPYEGL